MKIVGVAVLVVFLIVLAPAQEVMGIKIQGRISDVVAKFEEKGFAEKVSKKNVTYMLGRVGNRDVELWLACTPKTKLAWKAQVAFKDKFAWDELRTQFEEMRDAFIEIYGEPSYDNNFFNSPSAEGDGNWTFTVSLDEAHFASAWAFDDHVILLEISKRRQVTVSYDNTANRAIDDMERAHVDRIDF